MELSKEIQQRCGAAALRYAQSEYHGAGPDLAAMLEAAALRGGEHVLDVGCGAGHTALCFAPHVAEVVALDLTDAMLEQTRALAASRGLANLRCERGDAHALPFEDASFDVVTCRVCAHHFARPGHAVREAARVLRPGGRYLLVDSVVPDDAAQDTFLNAIEWLRDPSHVRNHAVALTEAGNLLMMAPRAKDGGEWMKRSEEMIEQGEAAMHAAEAKDWDKLFTVGGDIYDSCSKCHRQYLDAIVNANK